MGFSWGTPVGASNGYAFWAGPYRVESSGFPVSRFQNTGPDYTYDLTTDYNYENGNAMWSAYVSPWYEKHEYKETTPAEGYQQESTVRYGSMQYECHNDVCTMVPVA